MPDLDLPALRAVIAGVREKIPGLVLASRDERHSTGMLYREAASDLTTLADACERLAEENARLREALEEREGDMHLRIRAGYDKTVADSWRQENTRLREAVLASLAAAEAVAGEVREACVRSLNGMQRLYLGSNHVFVAKVLSDAKNAIHSVPLPTPSAALQRVREQEAERALRWAADHPCGTGGLADLLGAVADDPRDQWAGYVKRGLAALFPTTDAGGAA